MTSKSEKEDNVHVGQFGPEISAGKRESVADVLVRARERHGQNLRSVAQILRIRLPYLEALENGDFDKLPGAAYALGFLRTYADYLGLNADNIVDRYKEEAQATERPTELIFPEPVVEGRIPGGAIILISVVLLTVAYGSWFALTNQGRSIADLVPALPDRIQALIESDPDTPAAAPLSEPDPAPIQVEAPPEPAPATLAPAVTESQPEAAPEPVPETESVALNGGDQPAETTQTATRIQAAALPQEDSVSDTAPLDYTSPLSDPAPVPVLEAPSQAEAPLPAPEPRTSLEAREESQETGVRNEPEAEIVQTIVIPAPPSTTQDFASLGERTPRVYGQGNDGARIVLRALQDSWVQVRDNQDALLLTRVLRSGDIYKVPDQAGLTLLTGNAGGIQLEVDGVAVAPLGPIGAVRRQIALDPSVLLTGSTQ